MRHKNSHRLNGLIQDDGSSTDEESTESAKSPSKVRRGLRKIGSVFRRSPRDEDKSGPLGEPDPSPRDNIRALNAKEVGVKWVTDSTVNPQSLKTPKEVEEEVDEGNDPGSPQAHVKDVAKSILKQAGKSARSFKSAFSRKVSGKSRGESTDKDGSSGRDWSDDDSLSSGRVAPSLVIPGEAVCSPESVPGNSNSFTSTDNDMVPAGAGSGNNSFNPVDGTVKAPA